MAILHRIFIKNKHKKSKNKDNKGYKKFLGLKTLQASPYKKIESENSSVEKPKIKKIVKRKIPQLKFPSMAMLTLPQRKAEIIAAHLDVSRFREIIAEPIDTPPVEKFQAFLPQHVWDSMSAVDRHAHIKKRQTIAINPPTSTLKPKFDFAQKNGRPFLNKINMPRRKLYLQNLIKMAAENEVTIKANKAVTPALVEILSLQRTKLNIKLSKQKRSKHNGLNNITCFSLGAIASKRY